MASSGRHSMRACIGGCEIARIGVLLSSSVAAAAQPDVSFERHIRPILRAHCLECHGDDVAKKGLDTRQARLLLEGGKAGPAIVPGKSAESLLFQRVSKGEMPEIHPCWITGPHR